MISCRLSSVFAKHISTLLSLLAVTACLCAADAAPQKHAIDVPADTVETAIKKLSQQSGVDILVPTRAVRGLRSKPVKGEYTAREALELMLAGTGLAIEQNARSGVLTVRNTTAAQGAKNGPPAGAAGSNDPRAGHPSAATAPAQNVTVTGRVFSVATDSYLQNAEVRVTGAENYVYTGADGSYSISVPAGAVSLTASYSGARSMTASLTAAPSTPNILNFDLQPVIVDAAAAATPDDPAGPVVVLDRFEVTADREGQARAIMDQRAAINAVTIIAADNYGDVTMGSLGEVLKYLPGISLEYGEAEAEGVRIGGLPSKYTTVAFDGVGISTNDRSVNLNTLTSTGIETIEFIQTLTASMDAGAAAGRLNFRTRDPFSRRGRQIRYQFGLNGHGSALSWGGAYLPDDHKHNLILPSAQIGYGDLFFNKRLAIDLNLSYNGTYNLVERHMVTYTYRNPGVINPNYDLLGDEPVIAALMWRPHIQLVNRYGGNLNIGYKLTPALTLSVQSGFAYEQRETYSLGTALRAYNSGGAYVKYSPIAGIDRIESTPTHWVVNPTGAAASASPRLSLDYTHRDITTTTKFVTPRLAYKRDNFSAEIYGGYTSSTVRYRDTDKGFFFSSNAHVSNMSWVANRPSIGSPTWTLSQPQGDSWAKLENWGKRDNASYGIQSRPIHQTNDQYVGGLDLAYVRNVFGMPVTFKAGGLFRSNDYNYRAWDNRYNYLGPTGIPQEAPLPYTQNYAWHISLNGKSGNVNDQGWRVNNTYAIHDIYREHPEWFAPDAYSNLLRDITRKRDLTEDISAGYFELNSRVNRLRFNLGARIEKTEVETLFQRRRTNAEVAADGLDPGTVEGLLYQYYYGERDKRTNSYTNAFLSGGLKYDITRNLQAQLSASQSIMRPDYVNLSGVITYDEDLETTVTVPNGTLKPEYMTKFFAGLNLRLEPAGILSLYAYRMDIKDKQIRDVTISREEAEAIVGYPLLDETASEEEEGGSTFRTTINSPSRLSVYGVTLEYNQQLKFLPGYLKGLSVFSSVTLSSIRGVQIDEDRIGQVKKSASGGLRYRVGRVHIQLRGTWQGPYLFSVTRPVDTNYAFLDDHLYEKARLIVDLSGGFKLTNRCELTFSIRNLADSPRILYSNVPGRLAYYWVPGTIWNVSLKGSF